MGDVITRAQFELNRFRGWRATVTPIFLFPIIEISYHLTTVSSTVQSHSHESGGFDPSPGWLTIVLQCCDGADPGTQVNSASAIPPWVGTVSTQWKLGK